MISKERLKELIEQKATIWADDYGEIQLCNKSEVCNTIAFTGNHQIQEGYCLSGFIYNDEFISDNIEPGELEEDVEKGKWNYEIHTSRLERFDPPTWEDFLKTKEYKFISYDGFRKKIYIEPTTGKLSSCTKFIGKPTKENYIKACEMARKLFLEEKTDGKE